MKISPGYYLATVVLCLLAFSECKKKDVTPPPPPPPTPTVFAPAVTDVGIPTGLINSAPIDASGGTIFSIDGRLEIIIPANAVDSLTVLSLQPITNESPGGSGPAYRLSPDGQKFNLPVTVRFHYIPDDLIGTDVRSLGVAFQQADHIWYSSDDMQLDSVSATASIQTKTVADWTLFKNLVIQPVAAQIPVLSSITLTVYWEEKGASVLDSSGDPLRALSIFKPYESETQVSWYVNGVSGGNSNSGYVTPVDNSIYTSYTAPAVILNMPSNPAEVTAQVNDPITGIHVLTSEITVVDDTNIKRYKLTLVQDYSFIGAAGGFSGHCAWGPYVEGATIYFTDSVNIIKLDSIVNVVPSDSYSSYGGCNCTEVTFTPEGMMNFTSFSGSIVTGNVMTYQWTYDASTPKEVYVCTPDPPVTDDATFVTIPESDIVSLPMDSIVYPWNYGTLTIWRL